MRLRLPSFLGWWSSWGTLIAAACGGGDGGGGDGKSQQLTELSTAELDAQCRAWDSRATEDPEVLEGFCRLRGAGRALLDPQLASMDPVVVCEMEMQRCMIAPPVELCYGELRPECTASLDDFGGCVDARLSQWRMAASRTCQEQLTRLMQMRMAEQIGMPFPDPSAEACEATEDCFVPVIIMNPDGSTTIGDAPSPTAGASGANGMAGSAGTSGLPNAGAGGAGAGGAGALMPDATCMAEYPNPDQECSRCVCTPQSQPATPGTGCLELYRNCFENPDPMFEMRCAAVIACTIEGHCVGSACYAAAPLCMAQIDAAAMYPAGSTLASCSMGEMGSSACRAAVLLGACTNYDSTMQDGPCREACGGP